METKKVNQLLNRIFQKDRKKKSKFKIKYDDYIDRLNIFVIIIDTKIIIFI